jgi:hypothetical protein
MPYNDVHRVTENYTPRRKGEGNEAYKLSRLSGLKMPMAAIASNAEAS